MKALSKKFEWGTWFHYDTVTATYNQLASILGPHDCDGDKSNFEWIRETNAGDIVTIYDYKEGYTGKDTRIDWHIGAYTKESSLDAQKELKIALEMLAVSQTQQAHDDQSLDRETGGYHLFI